MAWMLFTFEVSFADQGALPNAVKSGEVCSLFRPWLIFHLLLWMASMFSPGYMQSTIEGDGFHQFNQMFLPGFIALTKNLAICRCVCARGSVLGLPHYALQPNRIQLPINNRGDCQIKEHYHKHWRGPTAPLHRRREALRKGEVKR